MSVSGEPTNLESIRQEIVRRLDSLSLPLANRPKIFGGYGDNQLCDCCEAPIEGSEVLYETEMEQESERVTLSMHRWCFDIWMEESLARHRRAHE
jgi:hypothetical protein